MEKLSTQKMEMKKNNSPFEKLIFLFGPTSVGKTGLLSRICREKFSVINADSIQVYKDLDIGSAKVSKDIIDKIPHYLVDIIPPTEQFTVADFIERADAACIDSYNKGLTPIISGGTAFYFKHFLYGLSEAPPSNPVIRAEIEKEVKEKGLAFVRKKLKLVDPVSYERINENDSYRICRALEVFATAGKPLSTFSIPTTPRYNMKPLIIGLYRDKEEMKQRLISRFDYMIGQGLVEELRYLIRNGASLEWPGIQGIGYKEFFDALRTGEFSLSKIGDEIVSNSRKYAKRQYTFFKSFENVNWIYGGDTETITKTIMDYVNS